MQTFEEKTLTNETVIKIMQETFNQVPVPFIVYTILGFFTFLAEIDPYS